MADDKIPACGPGSNTGHGHVWERPDGTKARCMGPVGCRPCAMHLAEYGSIEDRLKREDRAQHTETRVFELEHKLARLRKRAVELLLSAGIPETFAERLLDEQPREK